MTEITVHPVHPDDAADLYEMVRDPRVNATLVQSPSMEFSETQKWMEERKPGQHRFVAEVDGKVVGSCGLTQFLNPRVRHIGKLGLMVHADYWGQGVGSALMAAQMNLADHWLNLHRVQLDVLTDNPAAIHLYEKFGFAIEGTKRMNVFGGDGRFHDEYQMARLHNTESLHNSRTAPSPPPRPPRRQASQPVDIRAMHPDDLDDLHDLWRHPAVARTTLQLPSQEISFARERVGTLPRGGHRLVSVVEGKVVGTIFLFQGQNPRMAHTGDLGMMVHPDYWGMGIGSGLMAAILEIADNWLNLRRVELEVNVDNPPAVKLYEKFGFEIEGTMPFHTFGDGRWADSYFMGRIN
ncbi:MAG: GNAT family N-acetyltransferase [Ardenticatenaceae bacterium]|nr:GNAT family N-acetyltransferase [Ardenticatenaceae bacterium]MCB9003433.1 GNAT family N-acetyltransferase [Ardenticatenaceae bacterium]